jgi:hypothetical protein
MSYFKKYDKKVKKLDIYDIKLIKLSSIAFILFLITVWPAAMNLVHNIHWGWFLAASILASWRPMRKFLK